MTKRLFLSISYLFVLSATFADPITVEQARQAATKFLLDRQAAGSGPHHSASTTPQLTIAGDVCGLYVFNISSDRGFVVVSGDDCAETILGYSDNGSFKPQEIPNNMRAWLQGYADEIEWAKKHSVKNAATPHAPMRSLSTAKTPIAPLLTSTWNQDNPYNANCPTYTNNQVEKKCATGCVATAMAQVMYYHKWPVNTTIEIPAYPADNPTLGPLQPTTFDWDNMIDNYIDNNYTDVQASVVAKLMVYCGYSVEMIYGPESSSYTYKVADALKNYYDYNTETVTCISRSNYTYANWIELIYHELSEERPVVYGGASSGGGHEFVCDDYQGEDFFHINWGWGGVSDNYFRLSALNPYSQGIGGSSSRDGFHYSQDAVVGIMKNSDQGTVLNVENQGKPNLLLNSITANQTTVAMGRRI